MTINEEFRVLALAIQRGDAAAAQVLLPVFATALDAHVADVENGGMSYAPSFTAEMWAVRALPEFRKGDKLPDLEPGFDQKAGRYFTAVQA